MARYCPGSVTLRFPGSHQRRLQKATPSAPQTSAFGPPKKGRFSSPFPPLVFGPDRATQNVGQLAPAPNSTVDFGWKHTGARLRPPMPTEFSPNWGASPFKTAVNGETVDPPRSHPKIDPKTGVQNHPRKTPKSEPMETPKRALWAGGSGVILPCLSMGEASVRCSGLGGRRGQVAVPPTSDLSASPVVR